MLRAIRAESDRHADDQTVLLAGGAGPRPTPCLGRCRRMKPAMRRALAWTEPVRVDIEPVRPMNRSP